MSTLAGFHSIPYFRYPAELLGEGAEEIGDDAEIAEQYTMALF